jgi:hypothetical protein
MRTTLRFLFLPLASLLLLQCDDDSKVACNRETFVKSVNDVDAKIRFDNNFKTYVVSVQYGIDADDIGLVCDLQKELRKEGLDVVFDGSYYKYDGPVKERLGGHTYYYLDVSKITAK